MVQYITILSHIIYLNRKFSWHIFAAVTLMSTVMVACVYVVLSILCCRRADNTTRAIECFQRSVQLNPFLWSSYESLCLIGNFIVIYYT